LGWLDVCYPRDFFLRFSPVCLPFPIRYHQSSRFPITHEILFMISPWMASPLGRDDPTLDQAALCPIESSGSPPYLDSPGAHIVMKTFGPLTIGADRRSTNVKDVFFIGCDNAFFLIHLSDGVRFFVVFTFFFFVYASTSFPPSPLTFILASDS